MLQIFEAIVFEILRTIFLNFALGKLQKAGFCGL